MAALLAMVPLVFCFTSEGTWRVTHTRDDSAYSGHFYMAQAASMSHGRLDVERSSIWSECWFRDGRCYGYFGVTPSLLRLPVLGVLRWLRSPLAALYLAAAVLLGYFVAFRLLARGLLEFVPAGVPNRHVLVYFAIGALVLGPGGVLLFDARPAVYEEASAWCIAFYLLAVERVWAWYRTRRMRSLVVAIVCGVAAANARPTAVTACVVLGLAVAVLGWRTAGPLLRRERRRVIVAAACLSLLPLATSAGVFWLKFRTPFPDLTLNEQVPEAEFWRDILTINGGKTRGLVFAPTELVAYFRPDVLRWEPKWPYAAFAFPTAEILWVPPLRAGGAYVERAASVSATMPLPWIVTFAGAFWLVWLGWRSPTLREGDWILATGLLASAAAFITLTVTTVGITNRYLCDFFPASVVGMSLGHRAILPGLARRPALRTTVFVAALLLALFSVTVTVLLTTRVVFW